ncbi:MAG: hypothetical protein OJF49_004454 [Ktedonobacterales bacterium]|jgi:parvulin-like peptidyl-prolyl isomerase|nr:MAG: hypothetical protein OJF49_004454 [Ktedonobacterales bacterium]
MRIFRLPAGFRRLSLPLALGALLSVLLLTGCGAGNGSGPLYAATVNGQGISLNDYLAVQTYDIANAGRQSTATDWQSPNGRPGLASAQQGSLDFLVNTELMRQQVAACNLHITSAQRVTLRKQIAQSIAQGKQAIKQDPSLAPVLDSLTPDLQNIFVNQESYQDALMGAVSVPSAHVRVIEVAKQDQAQQLLQQVQSGADFGELAKANSLDTQSAPNGGEFGTVYVGQFATALPDFDKIAFAGVNPATTAAGCAAKNTYPKGSDKPRYFILSANGQYVLFEVSQISDAPLKGISNSQQQQAAFAAWLADDVRHDAKIAYHIAPATNEQPQQSQQPQQ